jgi:signal transduction histidine kinase
MGLPRLTSASGSTEAKKPGRGRTGGFGLGLAMVRWIAGSHRGSVAFDSLPDAGATFTVRLPQRQFIVSS